MRHANTGNIKLGTHGLLNWQHLTLQPSEAKTHQHVIGISGSGKSRYLASLFVSYIKAGFAATLLDPHGDLARLVLHMLIADGFYNSEEALEQLIYLDLPGAEEHDLFLPLNVLKQAGREDIIAANVKEAFHRAWPELASGAATFDTLLVDSVLLLLHNNLPLVAIHRLLTSDSFREALLSAEQDQALVDSFRNVYHELRKSDQVQYAGSVLRRARQLEQLQSFRYGLGQPDLAIDFASLMHRNQSLIVNLFFPNQDVSALLGCFFTIMAEHAALSRGALPENERTPHFLILDEFATFTTKDDRALSTMLSQTRKMGLFAVLAHQNWSQTSARLKGALQNCGLKVAFALDYDDALITSRILGRVDPLTLHQRIDDGSGSESVGMPEQWHKLIQELQDLPPRTAFIRKPLSPWPAPWHRLLKRPTSALYKVRTLPVPNPRVDSRLVEHVEREYRRRYFRPKREIERQTLNAPPANARLRRSGLVRV